MTAWPWRPLEELVADEPNALTDGPFGSKLKTEHYTANGVRVVRLGNIGVGEFKHDDRSFVGEEHAASLARHRLAEGDLLIAALAEPVGRCCEVPRAILPAIVKADCIRFRPRPDHNRRFIMHWLNSPQGQKSAERHSHGVGRLRINMTAIRELPIPVPERSVQDRIVAAIETHFSRLDAAVASLNRAKANVKRARASVLQAAVEGRLVPTEAALARAEGRDYEPASALLARILEERRSASFANRRRARTDEPVSGAESSHALPVGWVWTSMDSVSEVTGGLTKNAARGARERSVPYLRVANVYADDLRLDEVLEIGVSEEELQRLLLRRDDLLIVEGNGSPDQLGRVAIWNGALPTCVHQNHLIRARPRNPCAPRWLLHWLLSPSGRKAIESVASSTSGLHTLSISKVQALPVPLPPLAEQHRIVAEVDRRLSVLDALDATLDATLARCARLRQSILQRAFSGRLVPTEPTRPGADESLMAMA